MVSVVSVVSAGRVRRDLAEAAELYQRCESLLVRFPPAFTQRVAGGGSTGGLVLDEQVTEARRNLVAVLASWSGLVADERGVRQPGRDAGELAAFLAVHLDWLLEHPAGSCFAAELCAAAATAREVSRCGSGPGIELGPCVAEGCDQMMVATRVSSSSLSPSLSLEVRCGAGHAWAPRQWLRLARELEARGPEVRA